jgi:hypothetical protein
MKTSIYRQHAGLVYAVADPIDRGRPDESVDSQVSIDFTRQRRAQPVAFLLPSTQKWLEGLPRRVQPHVLCDYYPRIANSLAAMWEDTEGLRAYFDELFIDRRGGRRGFPSDVLNDLRILRYYLAGSSHDKPGYKPPK